MQRTTLSSWSTAVITITEMRLSASTSARSRSSLA
jgi:hypothetical protein